MTYDVSKLIDDSLIAYNEGKFLTLEDMIHHVAREVRNACAATARNYDEAHGHVGELIAKAIEADILVD